VFWQEMSAGVAECEQNTATLNRLRSCDTALRCFIFPGASHTIFQLIRRALDFQKGSFRIGNPEKFASSSSASSMATPSEVLTIGKNITVLPVIHGSGDFAVEVRRVMLSRSFDCLAVPLPPSFQQEVEAAVAMLPEVSVVLQRNSTGAFRTSSYDPSSESDDEEPNSPDPTCTFVPIDPCQPVIAALRIAIQERMHRGYIDVEADAFEPRSAVLPDPYALKHVVAEQFSAAVLPALPAPDDELQVSRIHALATGLRELTRRHSSILFVVSVLEWPWVRDAFNSVVDPPEATPAPENPARIYAVDPPTLTFVLGELPFITGLYERARDELDDDENLSVDGIKALLLTARDRYVAEFGTRARPITTHLLAVCLKYIRNLSLMERRLTPDLFTLVTAAQQTAGDQFAMCVAETARAYPYPSTEEYPDVRFGVDRVVIPDGTVLQPVSRLPGHPVSWRTLHLKSRPDVRQQIQWQRTWNPFGQCSWPPEDVAIERFRTHVRDVALELLGNDLARTEKFTSSIRDGLDIRETLRNWHTGDLYVKVFPPSRGTLDCVLMLFDSPADPRNYPWRITWHAEHQDESTLSLFATNFMSEMVGPGIGLARYGGCMFLFPPRPIPEVWTDPRFDFTDTLEERLLAASLFHSNERHVAVLSHKPPGAGWRRLASRYHKKLLYVPMSRFSAQTIEQLRMAHVLNGRHIRSFAQHFIRKP